MTDNPALTALALVELTQKHLLVPDQTADRTEELRTLLADPDDDLVHADYVANVAVELALIVTGIAVRTGYPLADLIDEYRRQLPGDQW
jgi:hypothetical protein